MFQQLMNFSYRRSLLQALGWYLFFLFIGFVIGFVAGGVAGTGSAGLLAFQRGAWAGQIIEIPYHITLGILLLWNRPKDVANILLFLAGVVLSVLLAALGGLIPLAVLTTRPILGRLSPPQGVDCVSQKVGDQHQLGASQESIQSPLPYGGSNDQVWQTFLDHDASISEAVERLSSLSQKNVEEFRALLLRHRDCSRAKEFEDEAVRRVQGAAFVDDETLRQTYISLNREDGRLGDEFVRVVGVIGKPKDLERTVAQVRKNVSAKGEAGIIVAQPTPSDIPLNREQEFASKQADELIAADRTRWPTSPSSQRPPPLHKGEWVMWGIVGVIVVGALFGFVEWRFNK